MKKMCLLTAIVCGLCSGLHATNDYDGYDTLGRVGWEDSYTYYNATIAPNAVVPGTGEGVVRQQTALMPGVGIGHRERLANQFGWDASFNVRTAGTAHQMDVGMLVHYYLQSACHDSMYVGSGIKVGSTWSNENTKLRHFWCMDSVVGKVLAAETSIRQFIEMHIACPTYKHIASTQYPYTKSNKLRAANPVVYLTYGMAF